MRIFIACAMVSLFVSGIVLGDVSNVQFGVRGNGMLGDGTPTNDVLGYGLYGNFALDDEWRVGGALDVADFDLERPWQIIGLTQASGTKTVDSKSTSKTVTLWLERMHNLNSSWDWTWQVGGGFNFVDVDRASGPSQGGGTFNISTNVDTEYLLLGGLGAEYKMSQQWIITGGARIEQHFADWKLTDSVSGTQGSVGDYRLMGISIGTRYQF